MDNFIAVKYARDILYILSLLLSFCNLYISSITNKSISRLSVFILLKYSTNFSWVKIRQNLSYFSILFELEIILCSGIDNAIFSKYSFLSAIVGKIIKTLLIIFLFIFKYSKIDAVFPKLVGALTIKFFPSFSLLSISTWKGWSTKLLILDLFFSL